MERSSIDYGEAEVIALALEKKTDLVLLDEKEAREVGFPDFGNGGFTHRGKTRGIILFKVIY